MQYIFQALTCIYISLQNYIQCENYIIYAYIFW
jgi:hypothetical protein